jgi:hypothetical protein
MVDMTTPFHERFRAMSLSISALDALLIPVTGFAP